MLVLLAFASRPYRRLSHAYAAAPVVDPNADEKRNPPMCSAIAAFSSLVLTLTDINACARSSAAAWVKCTT